MRKKAFAWILLCVLATGILAGCESGNQSTDVIQGTADDAVPEEAVNGNTDTVIAEANEGKALVVYYSATGSTEQVAKEIAEAVGAELFELEPVELYTSEDLDWSDSDSRVSTEYENPEQRDVELVSDTVDNWEEISVVYIGYPIWWGIAAWPVNGFVEANDFTGKTVIPFCTSLSSGLGESGELLAEMAGTGEWLEGMRFRSNTAAEDVRDWVEGLELK